MSQVNFTRIALLIATIFFVSANLSVLLASQVKVEIPDYYVTPSFLDDEKWGSLSLLPCREELAKQHVWGKRPFRQALRVGNRKVVDQSIMDIGEIQSRLVAADCSKDIVSDKYFALMIKNSKATWENLSASSQLTYYYHDTCALQRQVSLIIEFANEKPLLFTTQKPSSKDLKVHQLQKTGAAIQINDSEYKQAYSVPGGMGIESINTVAEYRRWQSREPGVDENGNIYYPFSVELKELALVAVTDSGSVLNVHKGHGEGHYGYSKPKIDRIYLLDVNGDGGADFIFDTENGGKVLVLTNAEQVLERQQLVAPHYSGIGGC